MFLFYKRVLVILLIEFLLILCENGLLTKDTITVSANGNTNISGPFLQIERPAITKLIITKPHLPHFLSCIATIEESYYYQNETDYFYTWFRNEHNLEKFQGRRNDFHIYRNGTLRLPPNERATGMYRCKINANITAVLSESITVEYPVLKRIPALANITAVAGLSLAFNCPVLSVPPANITWFYGNVSLSKMFKENRYLILANGSLVLRALTQKDDGKYKCLAQNQFSAKAHRQYIWSLAVEPRLNKTQNYAQLIPHLQNTTQYIPQGSELSLLCRASTDLVVIEWWFQRNHSPSAALVKLSNHSNEYHIIYASVEEHEGYYTCSTSYNNQSFHVIVTIPPTIIDPLPSYESLITASMTFRCRIFGNPRPVLSWYHNGALFNSSYTRYINGNELLIHSFDPDEDGIYQCFARNIAGEVYTAGELRYKSKGEDMLRKNPLQNIRCFAHSFNTINVTFDSKAAESLFIVHIVQNNPHRWISPFPPMKLNHTSYAVISTHLPVYRPFELITRVLFPTSEIRLGNKPQQQTILSSMRSPPVTCCTQGLLLHLVHIANDTFITWSQPDLNTKKYFILQFSINYTQPNPEHLLTSELRGTTQHIDLSQEDVARKLTHIEALNRTAAQLVLKRAESKIIDNDAQATHLEVEEDIFNLVVPANVTGILMQNFTRMKLRVLLITSENEYLAQDFRYVQWKMIENDTTEQMNTPFRLTTVESRMLIFHFQDSFNESCVQVCHWQIQFPIIKKEEPKCDRRTISHSQVEIRGLKPTERYRLNFLSCETQIFYGQLDVQTLPDPPGTISNQRVTRHYGLKLIWDPPVQPNGKIHHYNILWTLGNVTHEANVLECSVCFYKFPNISETAKINITVRVVGETGVGAPIFVDLRNINHHTLEIEQSASNSEVYSGIAIGSLLSTFCVFFFALLIIFQRRRFKARQQGPTHLTSPSDMNFGNLSNTGIPGDSAGGLSGSTIQQDCHEMQTLIPKSAGRHVEMLTERPNEYQTTQLPNGNSKVLRRQDHGDQETPLQNDFVGCSGHIISQIPMYTSASERRIRSMTIHDAKPFFIPFKHTPPNVDPVAQKHSSLKHFQVGGGALAPTALPLVASLPASNGSGAALRSGSLSSNSASSSSSSNSSSNCGGGSKKQFHTNFQKHSKSNDAICLLAEEESAASLTPTSETDVTGAAIANGFKATIENLNQPTTTTTSRKVAYSPSIITNKNATRKNSTKSSETTHSNLSSRLNAPAPPSSNTNTVPAIDRAAATATAKLWATPAPAPPTTAATAAATAAVATSHNLHRRPNVDPNG